MEEALKNAGEYGRLQRHVVALSCSMMIFLASQQFQAAFVAADPGFQCTDDKTSLTKDQCPSQGVTCNHYEFTSNTFTSIVTEWGLVCDLSYMASATQSMMMAGLFVGSLLAGSLSDKLGRRHLLGCSWIFMGVFGMAGSLSSSYNQYVLCRFMVGVFAGSASVVNFVLLTEITGTEQRGFLGLIFPIWFAGGIGVYAAIAWCVRDWRSISAITALPSIVALYLYKIIPESPRWLLSQGRVEEAEAVLLYIANYNNPYRDNADMKALHLIPPKVSSGNSASAFDIIRHSELRRRFLLNIPIWFSFSAVYYGMTMSAGSLGGNMWISVALSGLAEIPAYLLAMYILALLGRRTTVVGSLLISGTLCFVVLMLNADYVTSRVVVATIGKMCISVAFSVMYLYAAELFPTTIRNNGLGLCGTAGRLGGVVAPMLAPLNLIHPGAEYLSYVCMSIGAGVLTMQLPDTTGKPLPETIDDMNEGKR